MIAFSGVRSSCDIVARNSDFIRLACSSSMFFSCSVAFERLRSVDVARRGEHALQLVVAVVEGGGVVRDHRLLAVLGAHRQLVVAHLVLGEDPLDRRVGRGGSVKKLRQGAPISSSRVRPVSAIICWLTSEMMPCGSVIISASMFDSISERV